MSYPSDGIRYIDDIKSSPEECSDIITSFYTLREKYIKEHNHVSSEIDLTIPEQLSILGEAFEYGSYTLRGISDEYHFIEDILDELLRPKDCTIYPHHKI